MLDRAWSDGGKGTFLVVYDSMELLKFAEVLAQAVGFLLLGCGLCGTVGKVVDVGHAAVGFGFLGPKFRRFFQITKRIGILLAVSAFLCQSEASGVEQVQRSGITRIELMCVVKRAISRKILAQFHEDGSVESVQLK
jgi:hypothetical protein